MSCVDICRPALEPIWNRPSHCKISLIAASLPALSWAADQESGLIKGLGSLVRKTHAFVELAEQEMKRRLVGLTHDRGHERQTSIMEQTVTRKETNLYSCDGVRRRPWPHR